MLPVSKESFKEDEIIVAAEEDSPLEKGARGLSSDVDIEQSISPKNGHPPQSLLDRGETLRPAQQPARSPLILIVDDNPVDFPSIIVIVKRCHDELGAHKLYRIGEIMGSHRFAIGPAGFFVQLEIHGFFIFAESPMGCQLGNDIFSIWMDPYEPELIAS